MSINQLPLDVLALILRKLRDRMLIFVASLVCKRWRTLSLSLVTKAPSHLSDRVATLLPGVTSITHEKTTFDALCPYTALRQLKIWCYDDEECKCVLYSHISSLTDLDYGYVSCSEIARLLPRNAATLETLSITSRIWDHIDVPSLLTADVTLPRLTSLSLATVSRELARQLLERHCSQLTSLTLRQLVPSPTLTFPNLLRLSVDTKAAVVHSIVALAPKLQSVEVDSEAFGATELATVRDLLTKYHTAYDRVNEELLPFTRLQTLFVRGNPAASRPTWLHHFPTVTHLACAAELECLPQMRNYTGLTRLTTLLSDWPEGDDLRLSLPKLRHLDIMMHFKKERKSQWQASRMRKMICNLLKTCPSLRVVFINMPESVDVAADDVAEMKELCEAALILSLESLGIFSARLRSSAADLREVARKFPMLNVMIGTEMFEASP